MTGRAASAAPEREGAERPEGGDEPPLPSPGPEEGNEPALRAPPPGDEELPPGFWDDYDEAVPEEVRQRPEAPALDDPALALVSSLFPGRIVAVEPRRRPEEDAERVEPQAEDDG